MPRQCADASFDYRLFETEQFLKSLDRLQKSDAAFIYAKLTEYAYPQLRKEPRVGINIKKLRGYEPETWRYRIGRFRVFYTIEQNERIIKMVSVDFRKDAYR